MKGVGDTAISTLLGVGKALTGVGAIAATALIGFAASGVKAAMDVDHQLAQIAATLGTTKDAAMPLKDLMTELALDPKLTVNVTQAGEAIEVLAANGLELSDILAGGAKGAVQLANATGSDFATAATIATDAMQQFGFEANQLETVADGIAGVLVKSKFDANDYALALSNAGGIAGSLGVELSDFNTVLAATSSQFASGSDAGTSFKTLLTRLAKPTDEVAAAMAQYGLEIFDAEGKMKPFAEIAGQLNKVFNESFTVTTQVGGATKEQAKAAELASAKIGDLTRDIGLQEQKMKTLSDEYALQLTYYDAESPKMQKKKQQLEGLSNTITDQKEKLSEYQAAINLVSGAQSRSVTSTNKLTEEQKAALATTLGGTDAMRTILGLSEMTEEQFNALSAEVNKSGLASQAAATRVDSLTGAWEIFKGIIEAVQIQVGDKFLPIIRRVTEAVSVWASENSGQVVAFFGVIASGIDSVITKGTELFNAFQSGGATGLMAALGLSPEQIAMIENAVKLVTDNLDAIKGALIGIGAVVGVGILASLTAGLLAFVTPVTLLAAAAAVLGAAWAQNWGGIQEKTGAVVTYVTEQITALIAVLTPAFNSIWVSITQVSEAFAGAGVTSGTLTTALQAIGEFLVGVAIPAFVQFVGILAGTLAQAIAGIADGMIAGHNAFVVISDYITSTVIPAFLSMNDGISLIVELAASLGEVISAVLNKALQAMAGLWQNVLWPALQKVGNFLQDNIMPTFTSLGKTVKGDVSPVLKDFGETVLPLLNEGLEFVIQAIKDVIGYFDSLKATVNSFTLPDILTPGSPPPMANALTDIATSAGAATTALAGMQRSLITSSSSALSFIDDLDMGGLARGFGTGGGQWKNFRNILKNEIMGGMGALADGTADVMDSVYKVAARFNFPPGMAAEFAKANGLVEHLTGNFAEFKKQMNIENLGNMTQMAASFSGLGSTFADMLGPKLSETSKEIIYLQKFLATTDELSSDGLWNRVMGQEELVELLEKQARQEELITQQKEAQQKLDFLKSQLDLLKLGQSLGGDIFQGITFGLNASVEDMLAAVNAVTMAMVDQIDHDLGIASPSKLLFDKFKNQIGGAMVGGLLAVKPMMEGAIQPILNPIMQGANAAGRVVNNYFNQTVNTRADSSSVIGDFRTMQLMAG